MRLRDALGRWGQFTICPRLLPETERNWKGIDVELSPPCSLITRAMKFAVMDPTDRNDELVAHSASQGTRLYKGQMVRIRWHPAAH